MACSNGHFSDAGLKRGQIQKATVDGWVICVPRSGSLPKYALTHEDFFNHILIPSDELPETHFRTLNENDVRISNRVVTVEPGSRPNSTPFSRPTHILFEETYYSVDLLKYKVLCIEHPLEQFPDKYANETNMGLVTIETLRDGIDLLWTESGGKEVLERMDDAIANFLSRNNRLEFKPLQVQKDFVRNLYINCLQITMRDGRLREKTHVNQHFMDSVKVSVESYMHHGIYKKLIKGVTACTAYEDATFNKIVRNLSDIQLRDLDIRTNLSDTVPKARSELARVDGYSTVLGKVGCLKRTLAAISKHDSNSNQGNVVAADDLLPMFVFLVIKSGLPNWIAHLTYMKQFCFSSSSEYHIDQHSFLITSLEAAIEHIKSGLLLGSSSPELQIEHGNNQDDFQPAFEMVSMASKENSCYRKGKMSRSLSTLFDAARLGNAEEVESILEEYSQDVASTQPNNISTLCHPLCSCDKCERQLSLNLCNTTPTIHSCDDRGYTVLHIACIYGRPKVVDLLLSRGVNIHVTDYSGSTALHYASSRGHQNALLLLIHSGAQLDASDNDGNTPLHFAAVNGHEGCVKAGLYFSEHNAVKLDINKRNNQGDTPLHSASRWGYEMIVKLLLDHGADPTVENKRKLTPVDYAHNIHISRLLGSGVKFSTIKLIIPKFKNREKINMKAAASKIGLDFVDEPQQDRSPSNCDRPRTTEEIKKVERILRSISHGDTRLACFYLGLDLHSSIPKKKCHPLCDCKYKEDPDELGEARPSDELHANVCNVDGVTPLHVAAMHGRVELVQVLLDAGALPDSKTRKNVTPLHLACQHQRMQVAKLLLEANCDVNCQDFSGNSSLHYACQTSDYRLVQLLLNFNPKLTIRNINGKTALQEAEEKMSLTVVRLLSKVETGL